MRFEHKPLAADLTWQEKVGEADTCAAPADGRLVKCREVRRSKAPHNALRWQPEVTLVAIARPLYWCSGRL